MAGGETNSGGQLDQIIDALVVAEQIKQLEGMSEVHDE
jgi:hypothetical protein